MIETLSGSMMLLELPKPAFAVKSSLGLSDAERFVRKFIICAAAGATSSRVTDSWQHVVVEVDVVLRHLDRAELVVRGHR